MSLLFNGVEIPTGGDVIFGGNSFNEVKFNGVTYWTKGSGSDTPPVPTFCNASDGDYTTHVLVQWGYSGIDVVYKIFRDGVVIGESSEDLWFEDSTAVELQEYEYYVTACYIVDDPSTCSGPSEIDTGFSDDVFTPGDAPVTKPGSFTASYKIFWDTVNLGWNNGGETNADSVNIYRDDVFIDRIPFGASEYRDAAIDEGTEYVYQIAFWNVWGEGPLSDPSTGALKDGDFVPPHKHEPIDLLSQGHQAGLGIDADMLDGEHGSFYSPDTHTHTASEVGAPGGSWSFDATSAVLTITIP